MVVASANNGAVENLSKELPLLKEAIRYEDANKKDNEKMAAYHQAYAEEAEELDLFRDYAQDLLKSEEAWGLFSGAFGKGSNIQAIRETLKKGFDGHRSFSDYLVHTANDHSWTEAVAEFKALREEIEADQAALKAYVQSMEVAEAIAAEAKELPTLIQEKQKQADELEEERKNLQAQENMHRQRIETLQKPGLFEKVKALFLGPTEEERTLKSELDEVLEKITEQVKEQAKNKEEIKALQQKK